MPYFSESDEDFISSPNSTSESPSVSRTGSREGTLLNVYTLYKNRNFLKTNLINSFFETYIYSRKLSILY